MTLPLLLLVLSFPGLDQAEAAYQDEKFAEALTLYESMLSVPGIDEGKVLFNAGNCSYRLGDFSDAVLYYRRARHRLPDDAQVGFNLRLAEKEIGLSESEPVPLSTSVLLFVNELTTGEILWWIFCLQSVGLAGGVFLTKMTRLRFASMSLVGVGLILSFYTLRTRWSPGPWEGMVRSREIKLHSEPHGDFPVTGRLTVGQPLRVEEMSDRWMRIRSQEGEGWTKSEGVGLVD